MSFLFYLLFIYLILLIIYYFIYLKNLNYDNLFIIILNFVFLCILPLYYAYFKDNIYSLIISFFLFIASFLLNLKIKEIFHYIKIFPLIYFLLTIYILGYLINLVF